MRRILILCLALPLFAPVAARAGATDFLELTLPRAFVDDSYWDQVLDRNGGEKVLFGVEIAGDSPYQRNPGRSFMPASVTKLFTTGAALELLGPDFRYRTRMQWREFTAGDSTTIAELTLLGQGDPTWGMIEFNENLRTRVRGLVQVLREKGVRRLEGDVVLVAEDTRWDELRYPTGWSPEDATACYGALAQAFNLDINCAFYEVSGPHQGAWIGSTVPVPVNLRIQAGPQTALRVRAQGPAGGVADSFTIEGTWARGSRPERLYLPIHRTKDWVAGIFREELARVGIRVARRSVKVGAGELQIYDSFSPPLSELIRPLNKSSLNMLADGLFKTMGQHFGDPGLSLLDSGTQVMAEFLRGLGSRTAGMLGLEVIPGFYSEHLLLWDGSGISRQNRVTTGGVMALLRDLSVAPFFPALWESLPIAGTDGTLETRMRGTAAEGVLRGKTGTLRGVYNLAGYVPRLRGGRIVEFVPFVILSDTSVENKEAARAAQDRLGAALTTAINGTGAAQALLP